MKKQIQIFAFLFAIIIGMSSCSLTMPVNATSNPVGTKVGMAKATGFLGVVFFDQDASIRKAAANAGITQISTVDVRHVSYLGIVVQFETIVTGE
jgi:hypothetical protein